MKPDLVVGRDRAHVRELSDQFWQAEIVSAQAFFDLVRSFIFLGDPAIRRDDLAPRLIMERLLDKDASFPKSLAPNFVSLYSSCFHGLHAPDDVLQALQSSDESDKRHQEIFKLLCELDARMVKLGLMHNVKALFASYELINQYQKLPPSLFGYRHISLRHLIDLTMLEIEVVKALSRLGLRFDICMPLDFNKRGINIAIDYTARIFEADALAENIELSFENIARPGPLSELVEALFIDGASISVNEEHISQKIWPTLLDEADKTASQIAEILQSSPRERIAVVVRSLDARALLFKSSLKRQGLSVRDRKGQALMQSPAGIFLASLLDARLHGLRHQELLVFLNHPLSKLHEQDWSKRAAMIKVLDRLGIDDRIYEEKRANPTDRIREKLNALAKLWAHDEKIKAHIKDVFDWLTRLDHILLTMTPKASLATHLRVMKDLIANLLLETDSSVLNLLQALENLIRSSKLCEGDNEISLKDCWLLLQNELARLTVPHADNPDYYAVEFLLLPELLGRHFDHIFIVDMAFGRLPKSLAPDALLDDNDRRSINRLMKKTLLRIFMDDPFEPMITPPRQALEPFWFASSIASAQKSVHFSVAVRDEMGREQIPSEFFNYLSKHLLNICHGAPPTSLPGPPSSSRGLSAGSSEVPATLDPADKPRDDEGGLPDDKGGLRALNAQRLRLLQGQQQEEHLYKDIIKARKIAFGDGGPGQAYAFHFGNLGPLKNYGGQTPKLVLSPTMIEAFYPCRLRGLFERIMTLKPSRSEDDDLDARALGQIAHRALERYDQDHLVPLVDIVAQSADEYSANNFVANTMVMRCHQEWLSDALNLLIANMQNDDTLKNCVAREINFGLKHSRYAPLLISANKRHYLLGGRVDRIEKEADNFLIIDFKMSASSMLKSKTSALSLWQGNFQAPIYLRLVAEHFGHQNVAQISFRFASIRDAELMPALNVHTHKELFAQIFDDQRPDSLAHAIDAIFAPLLKGDALPVTGDHCSTCSYSFICRRAEGVKA